MDLASEGGLASFAYMTAFLGVLFSSVLAHELAHSLVAMRNGVKVNQITLWPLGGIASIGSVKGAWKEFKISVAGPLMSLSLGFVLLLAALLFISPAALIDGIRSDSIMESPSALNFLVLCVYVNIILGLFNLFLPIFPMDGGRVLRSMLEMLTNRLTATRIAILIGQGFLAVFITLALLLGSLWLVVLGVFLFMAGFTELKVTQMGALLEKVDLSGAVVTNIIALGPDMPIKDFLRIEPKNQGIYPVTDIKGKLLGVFEAKNAAGKTGSIAENMQKDFAVSSISGDRESLIANIYSSGYSFITDKNGVLFGVLTAEVMKALIESVKSAQ